MRRPAIAANSDDEDRFLQLAQRLTSDTNGERLVAVQRFTDDIVLVQNFDGAYGKPAVSCLTLVLDRIEIRP